MGRRTSDGIDGTGLTGIDGIDGTGLTGIDGIGLDRGVDEPRLQIVVSDDLVLEAPSSEPTFDDEAAHRWWEAPLQ